MEAVGRACVSTAGVHHLPLQLQPERLQQLQQGGQKDVADSWVGKGPNKPVDPNDESIEFWLKEAVDEALDLYVYMAAALDQVKTMRSRIAELEAENGILKTESRLARVEVTTLRNQIKLSNILQAKKERRSE